MDGNRRRLGTSKVSVPPIGFGTASLGGMPDTYGYDVDAERARAAAAAMLDLPVGFIDTSRNYGHGRAEERIGAAIAARGGWPEGRVLATKLDCDPETGRFDAARVRRSVEESLAALGVDHLDVLHLHDPEHARDIAEITRAGGALDELMKLRAEGIAGAVGLAAGRTDLMIPMVRDWDFDVVLNHNRFTIVNRHAEPLMDLVRDRGMAFFNAAPYAGGALAKGAARHRRYVYQEATDATLAPIRRVEEICARHGVPPGAVALQFSMCDPRVTATICGVSKPERIVETLDWAALPVPGELWEEIAALPFATDDPETTRAYKNG